MDIFDYDLKITLDKLKKRGYISLLEIYRKVSPQLSKPPCSSAEASAAHGTPPLKLRQYALLLR